MNFKIARFYLIALAALLLCSCRAQRVAVVEKAEAVRTDTILIERQRVDSVFVADKTEVYTRNDTIFCERWRYVYKDRLRTDTLWRTRTEVVTHTLTETKTEEVNRLKGWQMALMWSGGVSIVGAAAWFVFKLKRSL